MWSNAPVKNAQRNLLKLCSANKRSHKSLLRRTNWGTLLFTSVRVDFLWFQIFKRIPVLVMCHVCLLLFWGTAFTFPSKSRRSLQKNEHGKHIIFLPCVLHVTLLDALNLRRLVKWLVTLNSWNVLRHKLSIITQQTVCCSVLVPTGYTVPIFRKDAKGIRKRCWTSGLNAGWALQGFCGEGVCCGMWRCVTVCGCRAVCTHLLCNIARRSVCS